MSSTHARRSRVENNIYTRTTSTGKQAYEVGYRDGTGRQRWEQVTGGITVARNRRNELLAQRGRGERVVPNPKLRFGDAADAWMNKQVSDLKPATQSTYNTALECHLLPRWRRRRLDTITVEDVAMLVRDLRAEGRAEWTVAGVLTTTGRVFTFARRRMNWHGVNPVALLDKGERAKVSATARRPIFVGPQLAQTLAAAQEPYRTMFSLAAVTGARISEVLGLTWADINVDDLDTAEIRIEQQVDRHGHRSSLKTEESRRTIEIPRQLAVMLIAHKLRSTTTTPSAFVFATRTGRALNQKNVGDALRRAERDAVDDRGRPTFPVLHACDSNGKRLPVPRGTLPSFHSFRHHSASLAIAAGENAEEVSWQLGHKNSNITRAIYVREIKSAERTARRRARMEEQYGSILTAATN